MSAEIHVGDTGTKLELTVYDENNAVLDLSGATTRQITIAKPDGSVITRSATLSSDGTDGKMYITSASTDFDMPGVYSIQGYVVFSNGEWHTDITTFHVHENLP